MRTATSDLNILVKVSVAGTPPDCLYHVLIGKGPSPDSVGAPKTWNDPRIHVAIDRTMDAQEFSRFVDEWTTIAQNEMHHALALVASAEHLQHKAKGLRRGPSIEQLAARASDYFDPQAFLEAERSKSPYGRLTDSLGD